MTLPAPTRPLRSGLVAVAARWPTLLAWFLAGWVARVLLLRLAGHLGNEDAVYGLLVLPLAVLARLVSYVAIFTVVRDALLGATAPPDRRGLRDRLRDHGRRFGDTVLEAIVPFFVIYAAWSIIEDDIVAYARSSLDQVDIDAVRPGEGPLSASIGVLSVSMVLVAFALRQLLARWGDRRPRWSDAVSVYLEAVWVLVTVLVLRTLLADVPDWVRSRRMVSWVLDRADDLRDSVAWADRLLAGLGPAWSMVSDVVLLPLAWLALAGVVFARTLGDRAGRHDPPHVVRARARVEQLPSGWRRVVEGASKGLVERWDPVRRVATLAWRASPLSVAAYLLAFALAQAAPSWLFVAFARLAGPHELGWWNGVAGLTDLAIDVVVVPVQLAVVAIALFHLSAQAAQAAQRAPAAGLVATASAT